MPTELNISLNTNTEIPTIKFILTDELSATLSGLTSDVASNIKYVATGPQGQRGQDGAAGTPDIGDGDITNTMIEDGSITSSKLSTSSVTSTKISSNAVTSSKIGTNAVTTSKIANNSITASKIAPGVVTAELLADGIITQDKIPDGSIVTDKIVNGSITTAKIAEDSITKAKIASRTLTGAEIEENVTLDGVKIRGNAQLLGDSPAYLNGPTNDDLHIQSEANLIFKLDTNNNSNSASYVIKNGTDATLFSVDESGNVTINGNVTVTGTVDGVDVSTLPTTDTNTQLTTEQVQDIVGAMLTNNTETRVAVTYDDSDGTIDFVVDDMTADTNTQLPLIDSDTMTGALSTNVASAESVKAYVDGQTHLELGTTSTTALAGDTTTISTAQANAITANTAKVSFPGLGTTSTTALAGNTDLLQLGTSNTTAMVGDRTTISGAQASAITANTAKTGITTSQANAITANTAKVDLTVENAGTVHASNYTDTNTTYDVMGSGNSYAAGLVPAGSSVHETKFLRKDGTFAVPYVYLGMDGIALSFNQIAVDLKANGGLVIESGKIALDLGASSITNNLSEATSSADGLMSTAHHDKLDGIAAGAEVNVQSDWNATSGDAQILNKPTIPAAYTDSDAVSAVAAADNYIKNDANEVLAGSLEISEQLYILKSTGGSKTRIRNSSTTGNRTLEVPDASGTLALTSDIPSFTPNPTIIGQFSTRVSAYWSGRYYYGQANYGWNYYAWNYATTSKTSMNDQYVHMGMVSPISTNNVKVRATVRNDSNTENVQLCLLKGSRPNGSSSNISLTELGSVTVTITTQDLHYNGDIDVTDANLAAGDLIFLAVRRVSSAANATKYINVTATIYGE